MFTIEQLTEFFGWASAINIIILLFTTMMIITFKSGITKIHASLFGLPESDISASYFNYLANYKTLSFIFTIVPYVALKLMAGS